jgi:broad specificity phosphatase PhoE
MLEREEGCTVLVVTHGRFLRIVLASLLDEYGLARMHELPHSNTAVNRLVHRKDTFEAELLNCTAHLDDA